MRRRSEHRDVIIVGAGPAGSTAAIQLARAGRRVLMVERSLFPRDKVCGGCLSGPATRRLRPLLGADGPLPGVATESITFHFGRYRLRCTPQGAARLVLRRDLDARLAAAAVSAGAEFRCGRPARLDRGLDGWDVLVDDERFTAETVLVAAGIGSLGRRLGIRGRKAKRAMIAQQWKEPATSALPRLGCVEMHWLRAGYIGLATPAPNTCIVALAADAGAVGRATAVETLRRLNARAPVWDALALNAVADPRAKGSAGFPWLPERLGVDNVLLIGDAAGYEEPYTGEGMGQAMHSASSAAAAVLQRRNVLRNYTRAMRREHRPRLQRTRLIRALLSASLLHRLADMRPVLPHAPLARIVEHIHVRGTV